jgi:hypothetical protein
VQSGNTAGPFDGGDEMQQELGNTAGGDALRCPSLPGAGAKQEQRLFRDLPELPPTEPPFAGDSLFPQVSRLCR